MNEFTGERVVPGQVNVDLWNEHLARYAFARQFAKVPNALDLGCGSGYGSAELARSATRVTGLDVSAEAVQSARGSYPLSNLQFAEASCTAVPFPDGEFQLITAFEVIEHLDDWRELLSEAARLLTDDGLFLVSTPNKLYYAESREKQGPNPFHLHEFEYDEFRMALGEAFPHVAVLLQNRMECMAFYPALAAFWPPEARMDGTRGAPETANFFVALCSRRPLPDLRSFLYVPEAANVLREREQHIAKLAGELDLNQRWVTEARGERDTLLENLREQQAHLEQHNRWAQDLEQQWREAQARIVELQDQFAAEQKSALEQARTYEAKIEELERDAHAKAQWARDTEQRLTAELVRERGQFAETLARLETAESALAEETRRSLALEHTASQLQAQLDLARRSRWIGLGRKLGVGPQL